MPKPIPVLPVNRSDLENLQASGLTRETIRANGIRTETAANLRTMGFLCPSDGLLFPFRDLDGDPTDFARARPHRPRVDGDEKEVKYESPKGSKLRAYYPVHSLPGLCNEGGDVYVTEGEKKALALSQLGLAAVGVGGIWCGCKKDATGGHGLIDDLAAIDWAGRRVFIVFDWDAKASTRADAARATQRLATALRRAGAAMVYEVGLPPGPHGAKQGADDFLVANGPEAFIKLVDRATPVGGINAINGLAAGLGAAEPIRLIQLIPPVLGDDAYHGVIGRFLRAVAPHTEATDAGVLAHLLPAAGTLIGPGPRVFAGGWHPPRVNTVLVGPTSTGRKGTAMTPVDILMAHVDPGFWASQRVGGLATGEGLIAAVADALPNGDEDRPPVEKRLYVVEEEYSRVLAQARRDGNILSEVVREAFDSGNLSVLTRGNPLHARGAHISITGHITPEELAARLSGVDQANGFGNRFLWFAVKSDKIMPSTTPIPEDVFTEVAARLRAAADAPARTVTLTADAAAAWEGRVYAELREDRPGLAGAMSARGPAFVLRVALIYSQLDEPGRRGEIGLDHLNAALAVWEYSGASCYLLFRSLTGTPLGDKLVELLGARGPMKKSQFTDHIGRPVHEIDEALNALAAAGRVGKAKAKPAGPGRPPEIWELISQVRK